MEVQQIYAENINNFLFSKNDKIIKFREKILKKLTKDYLNKKNNESIKNIDLNLINNLDYKYQNVKVLNSIKVNNKNNYELNIVNGLLEDFHDDKIKINLINNKDSDIFFNNISFPQDDYIVDLNSLLTNSGYKLLIKKNQKVLLDIKNTFPDQNFTIFQKNFIKCEEGSDLTIIDNYHNNSSSFHNIIITIELENNSKFQHIIVQKNSEFDNLFLTTQTDCYKNTEYNQTTFNFSDGFVRNHHYGNLCDTGSVVNHSGVFFLKDINKADNKTYVRHLSESCKSDQIYKGILNGKSKATYYSNTFVEKNAQKTEGYQLSKGIILSDEATFFSKPELRIYADDVKCSHGSTIGPIDEQLIYYIRSRGISKKDATKILIKSFINDNFEKIRNGSIQKKIELYIENYLNHIN